MEMYAYYFTSMVSSINIWKNQTIFLDKEDELTGYEEKDL